MRAIFEAIDPSPHGLKLRGHPVVQRVNGGLIVISAGHAGLVGDDEDMTAAVIEQADGFPGSVEPFHLVRSVHISKIAVQNTVAIEETAGRSR